MTQNLLDQLATLARDLDTATRLLSRFEEEAAEAEAAYRVSFARAYMRASGKSEGDTRATAGTREHQATIECEDQLLRRLRASAVRDAQREHIRTLRVRIDIGRTLAATDRAMSQI